MGLAEQTSKAEMRSRLSSERTRLLTDERQFAGFAGGFQHQLAKLVQETGARSVAAYLPFGSEPDIGGFLELALERGPELVMPVSQADGTLKWVLWTGKSAPGIWGFDEPVGVSADLRDVALVIVPALAVDPQGNRLGKGKGYYDRALEQVPSGAKVLAVVFDSEVLPNLPAESHDRRVNGAVTPTRTVWFNG